MTTIFDNRQSRQIAGLDQVAPTANTTTDNIMVSINSELTMPLRMTLSSNPGLVVSVGNIQVQNPQSSRFRTIPPINNLLPTFSSGTVTLPSSNNTSITVSPGTAATLNIVTSGNFKKIGLNLDATGNINLTFGAEASTIANATAPVTPSGMFGIGYIIAQNIGGTIQNLTNASLVQYQGGGGSGGSGNASTILETIKNELVDSPYTLVTPNIINSAGSANFASLTGATYDNASNVIKFTANAQVAVSTNMLDPTEFLAAAVDVGSVDFSVFWNKGTTLQAFAVPTAFTYEVSRDGGNNYFPMTLSQVGSTEVFRGNFRFDTSTTTESSNQVISSQATNDSNATVNITTQQQMSQAFTLSATTKLQTVTLTLVKTGSPTGNLFVSIIKDNAGSPSTSLSDVLSQSNAVNISTYSNTAITIPGVVLAAGTYHIVVSTDAGYKGIYSAGVTQIALATKQTAPASPFVHQYNGTTWSTFSPNADLVYSLNGRALDLRVRITSAGSPTYPCGLDGWGIFYFLQNTGVVGASKKNQRFVFNSVNDNLNTFTITSFNVDPDLLSVYWVEGGQVFKSPAFSVNGNIITFPANTFSNNGVSQTITLIADQNSGGAVDSSSTNAANILNLQNWVTTSNTKDIVIAQKISVPSTGIINRAQMVDPVNDLGVRAGVERYSISYITPVPGELGANSEVVYKLANDPYDMFRFVGLWTAGQIDNNGARPYGHSSTSYMEVTFVGTGLNILCLMADSALAISVDGGSETTVTPTGLGTFNNRNYRQNCVINATSGLTFGIHTVKVRTSGGSTSFFGAEVLNESTNIKVSAGSSSVKGQKITTAASSTAYNSGFTNTLGTPGTKGGVALVYQTASGIQKDVQYTDASAAYGTSASHGNEEITGVYYARDFGQGRSDDFSTMNQGSSGNKGYTLDDGTTTLTGFNVAAIATPSPYDGVKMDTSTGQYLTFTFIGTGCDWIRADNASGGNDSVQLFIDNVLQTSLASAGVTDVRNERLVSGLPYGTHTIRINPNNVVTFRPEAIGFVVYGPKKPTLPTGAIALGSYDIMATYVASVNATANIPAAGTIRKAVSQREAQYSGTWSTSLSTANDSFWQTVSSTSGSFYTFEFVGTGIEISCDTNNGNAYNQTYSIDGATNLSGFTTSLLQTSSGLSFTNTTGVISGTSAAAGRMKLLISGLSYGYHKLKVLQNTSNTTLFSDVIDVITPFHSHKWNGPMSVNGELMVGSCAMTDMREFGNQLVVPNAKGTATAISNNPNTTSTSYVPANEMICKIKTKGGPVRVNYMSTVSSSGGGINAYADIYVNGQPYPLEDLGILIDVIASGNNVGLHHSAILMLPAGWHTIYIMQKTSGNTLIFSGRSRLLSVSEEA